MQAIRALDIPVIKAIAKVAQENNIQVYVIGGYVRDFLLDRRSKDIDLVVVGNGIEFAKKVANMLGVNKKVVVYKNFGTALVNYEDGQIEFVGARKESYRQHSRKPTVENGSLTDDQNRRDFTINALAISLNKGNYGAIIDPFNGINDLESGIIKTPLDPEKTFSDDPLRMIRAIRFSAQLEFYIKRDILDAIKKQKDRIKIVSKERIADELNKIILSDKPSIGFKLLFNTGILEIIFPHLYLMHGIEIIDGKGHKDNFLHTIQVLDNISLKTDNLWLRWAAILHDIAKPKTKRFDDTVGWTFHGHEEKGARMVPEIFRYLKLPLNEKMKYVKKMVLLHLRPIALVKTETTDSAIRRLLLEAGDDINDLMTLCEADITSKNKKRIEQYLHNFQIVRRKLNEVEEKDNLRNWQPPINGEVIIRTFNLKPGREVGIIKNAIREAIIEGIIENSYEQAYSYMVKIAANMGYLKK